MLGIYVVAMPTDAFNDTMLERCSVSGARLSLLTVFVDPLVVVEGVKKLCLPVA